MMNYRPWLRNFVDFIKFGKLRMAENPLILTWHDSS